MVRCVLEKLDVRNNRLGVSGGKAMGQLLEANHTLVWVNVGWNAITMGGAGAMAEAVSTNSTLRSLLVSWNGFGGGDTSLDASLPLDAGPPQVSGIEPPP